MSDKSLTLELVTPEKVAMQGQADFVVLPAFEGEMGVLPNHEPFLVQLTAGEVRVTENGQVRRFAVSGGFAEIKDNRVSLFAETAEMAEQIDAERAKQSLEKAKAEIAKKDIDPITLAAAEASLRRAQVRLLVATRRHGSAVKPRHEYSGTSRRGRGPRRAWNPSPRGRLPFGRPKRLFLVESRSCNMLLDF